ncbi:hypothetical protein M9Y10_027753 [Tritrichomonas musculus]|uniref:Tubulin/FtsZ GTPase domain-containing protein n=1 Tax=Tritrichomonas musculus TaxID=1915356 RepID=A0ABR2H503_9EUKA
MVREIVNIQIGQCGNKIGIQFWDMITRECHLMPTGSYCGSHDRSFDEIRVYFTETKEEKFIPRSVLVDFNKYEINQGQIMNLFKQENFFYDHSNFNSNWSSCFYASGSEISEPIADIIRREVELCDSPQGFQLIHSLGGFTGSCRGSSILSHLQDEYPDLIRSTFSVLPSQKVTDTEIDTYNCILSLSQLMLTCDQVFYFDNKDLFDFAYKDLRLSTPTYGDLNYIVACDMVGATCSLRNHCCLNSDLRKISINHIPFDRLKFLKATFAPATSRGSTRCYAYKVHDLTSILFGNNEEVLLGASVNFCGRFTSSDAVIEHMEEVNSKSGRDVDIKTSICHVCIENHWRSAASIKNSTDCIKKLRKQIYDFRSLFEKRACLHLFRSQGIDDPDFEIAEMDIIDLIQDYESYNLDNE